MQRILSAALLIFTITACGTSPTKSHLLVSTTSTQDSGLLDVLLPVFEEESGYTVQLVATGSGQALEMGRDGNADVILLHSPAAEEKFMEEGFGIDRRLVMHNDFVIVGPASDLASLQTQTSAAGAFASIFSSGATFVSRGDQSGTHVKEKAIWPRDDNDYSFRILL